MLNYATVKFLGASGTVTGSKFHINAFGKNILIDCGMFQGLKHLRNLNWKDLPIAVQDIDIILLTHGHLDHVGYLPRLIQQGFKGRIIGTLPTLAIAEIILRDSAKIHEEEAKKANEEQYSKHQPAQAFYTSLEVEKTLRLFQSAELDEWNELTPQISFQFQYNGHIIGSTFITLSINKRLFVFSGDVGRLNDYLLNPPNRPKWADFLFLESTYGHKLHAEENMEEILSSLILKTIREKGNLIIPSFAVERLQTLMYILWKMYLSRKIPGIPIYVDSPMGNNVLKIFNQFPEWHKLNREDFSAMENHIRIVSSYKETWETIDNPKSKIVIAGSGMVTGGRVLTYLQQLIDEPTTNILLVGYQAEGTRGRQLLEGVHELKFYGKYYPVKAQVHAVESLSAHADQMELIDWLSDIKNKPEQVFLIHGEATASNALRVKIKDTYGWESSIPSLNDEVKILI